MQIEISIDFPWWYGVVAGRENKKGFCGAGNGVTVCENFIKLFILL